MTDDETQLQSLIEAYRYSILALDPASMAGLWDAGHRPLIYIAMEKDAATRGWPAIERYFAELPTHLVAIEHMDIRDATFDVLGETAVVCFDFSARAQLRVGGTITPEGRVSVVCRRTTAGWRIIHYHESGQAAVARAQ